MHIKRMNAAILVEQNRHLEVAEIDLPDELFFGQVLVKVNYSGICGAQINEIQGAKGPDRYLPHLLGHEGSGKVIEIGAGVKTVKPGDVVVLHWRPSDGLQCDPPSYTWDGKKINAGWVTTFNEYAVVSENRVTAIPVDFDMKTAPLLGCAVTTAVGVVNNDANVQIGQSVVVFGVGGVGLNICQVAGIVSAYPIIGVDIKDSKKDMALKFGATHFLNAQRSTGLNDEVRKIVGEKGADVVVDTTGNARVIEQAYELTHPEGKTILVGVPKKGDNVSIYTLPLHFKKVLTGSHGGSIDPHVVIPRLIRLIEAGKMTLDGLITHEFRIYEINDALELVKGGDAGRVLINMA